MEGRTLFSVFTVTTTADDGPGSLRDAVMRANAAAGADEIHFNLAGAGVHTIQPLSPLPVVTDALILDATTQPGYGSRPLVELDGSRAGRAQGLVLHGGASVVRGFAINRFGLDGIKVDKGIARIEACFVGTNAAGDAQAGNGGAGVLVSDASVTIGGAAAGQGNLISGNYVGVAVVSGGAGKAEVSLSGNFIGTDADGAHSVGNKTFGIEVHAALKVRVGGIAPGFGNVISGNGASGVFLGPLWGLPDRSYVLGNLVGTDAAGTHAVPNGLDTYAFFRDGITNLNGIVPIGSSVTGSRNVISGNRGAGVRLAGAVGGGGLVQGNYIGTDATGRAALGNEQGVVLDGAAAEKNASFRLLGNLVSGNRGDGIQVVQNLSGSFVQGKSTIAGNYVGTDAAGAAAVPNGGSGIELQGVRNVTVGGANPSPPAIDPTGTGRNIVSGNSAHGIVVSDTRPRAGATTPLGVTIAGNYVGLTVDGLRPLGNGGSGIYLRGSAGVIVGTSALGFGNVISANGDNGVTVATPGFAVPGDGNRIDSNRIGTDAFGDETRGGVGNAGNGVAVLDGSATSVFANTIAFNGGNGVAVQGSSSSFGRTVIGSSIFSNGKLGIDILTPLEGVTANGPVIARAIATAEGTWVVVTGVGTIRFYASPQPDPSGYGEGKTPLQGVFLGTTTKTIAFLTDPAPVGSYITATQEPADSGTSEFSAAVRVESAESQPAPSVTGRSIFYNHSAFDGNTAGASPSDARAIATDKQALLHGQTVAFANVTSYVRGINGVMIDVRNMPLDTEAPDAADFTLRVNRDGTWTDAPAPVAIGRAFASAAGGSDRVTLIWADNAIRNEWLEVTVKATPKTGLRSADTFYFGSLVGETGADNTPTRVTALDVTRTAAAAAQDAPITSPFDFNRDGRVDALDRAVVWANLGRALPPLQPLSQTGAIPAIRTATAPLRRAGVWSVLDAAGVALTASE